MRAAVTLIVSHILAVGMVAGAGEPAAQQMPEFSDAEKRVIATLAPVVLPPPPPDHTNRFADVPAAAAFGRKLFFDMRFSGRLLEGDNDGTAHTLGRKGEAGRVACAGCHVAQAGFLDNRTLGFSISLAAGWGRRHTPSLNDVGQAKLLMWDGRRDALYNQIFEAIESHVEMNSSRLFVAQQLSRFHRSEYESIFGSLPAFDDPVQYPQISPENTGCTPRGAGPRAVCDGKQHGLPGDQAEYDQLPAVKQEAVTRAVVNVGKAIGAFERKLTCGQSRFDAWAQGRKDAMNASEQRGLKSFVGKAQCIRCHSGPYLSDQTFHNVGLVPRTVAVVFRDVVDDGAYAGVANAIKDPLNSRGKFSDGDDGRLPAAPVEQHRGAYKTPMLRCVSQRLAFMHTGQITSLADVVEFFSRGGTRDKLVGENELQQLDLSASEKADLVAFLKALDGPGSAKELLSP